MGHLGLVTLDEGAAYVVYGEFFAILKVRVTFGEWYVRIWRELRIYIPFVAPRCMMHTNISPNDLPWGGLQLGLQRRCLSRSEPLRPFLLSMLGESC